MHRLLLIGSGAPAVAFPLAPAVSDGWPGRQALWPEIVGVALLWLIVKLLFDTLNSPRGA